MARFNIGLMLRIGGRDVVLESLTPLSELKDEFHAELPPGTEIVLPRLDQDSLDSFESAVNGMLRTLGIDEDFTMPVKIEELPDFLQSVMNEIAHVEVKITRFSIHRFRDKKDETKHRLTYDMALGIGSDAGYGKVGPFEVNGLSLRVRSNDEDEEGTAKAA